jgi:FlaA1/EpsC-like NDP-sugar epimerase
MRLLSYLRVDSPGRERVAILGATAAGELTIIICLKQGLSALPVVVLETDPAANHTTIHGVPVRPAGADPACVLRKANAGTLIVPPNASLSPADREAIVACESAGVGVVRLEFLMTPLPRPRTPCRAVDDDTRNERAFI